MDLQEHAGAQSLLLQPPVDRHHRHLDEVGRGALDRGVDRHPFGRAGQLRVLAVQVWHIAAPALQRGHVPAHPGLDQDAVHVTLDPAVAGEILSDIRLRCLDGNPQGAGQTLRAHAIDNAEVDGLGLAALVGGHCGERHLKQFRRRAGVHVLSVLERLDEDGVLAEVGKQAQLNL